ncbi:uncharacterized protein LOC126291873 isoform X1 [Schistocerca gregaria]|uniref:uncharacterized protein LOC126291873 isoform X1 n=1 Tax=Schistocerca gregaria TaxID=7010 RepID=UPI00211EEFB5|nr:uncharacterized protein LOC126291873 isoform X1 [Schistocerca gregaria]XP_049841551.1 uncharacterized protein LOC126291873 isoform X1 [Schistocerca gregaria]XP_049841552.1 uncharacterized protein LOC126291873 isoform X1 [Schistocerca gregaria]
MLCRSLSRCVAVRPAAACAYRAATPENGRHPLTATSRSYAAGAEPSVVRSPFPDVEVPAVPVFQYMWQNLDRYPDRVATECGLTGRCYTYAEARAAARNFAGALVGAGLGPGHVLSVFLPNCPEFPIVVLGANEAGVVVTTTNPKYTADELSKQLRDCRPSAAVTTPALHGTVVRAFQEAGLPPPRLLVTVSAAASSTALDPGATPEGAADFQQLVQRAAPEGELPGALTSPDQVFIMPYSSGTTGLPKGVMLSNRNIVANLQQAREPAIQYSELGSDGVCGPDDAIPVVLPMFHIYGLSVVMLQKFSLGAKLVTLPKFEPQLYLDVLAKHKPQLLFLVPPMVLFLGGHPMVQRRHLESVRFVVSGAAPAGQMDIDRFLERASPATSFVQAYGLTEAAPCVLNSERTTKKQTTVGKPLPNTSVKVVDVETSRVLGPNQPGEIVTKGPQVMLGYYNNAKATAETLSADGWLRTGDIGYYDADSDFYIVDRIKELIKVKGFQVPPAELEEILRSHPAVEEAAVVGVPDERSGEVPRAYVVLKKKAQQVVTPQDVAKFVDAKVADYKKLAGGVHFIDAIPKNPSGKILRRVLKQQTR